MIVLEIISHFWSSEIILLLILLWELWMLSVF